MDVRSYLAEEVALDHADGMLSRREALRRLALLGLAAGPAASLLSASAASAQPTPAAGPAGAGAPSALPAAAARDIAFSGRGGQRLLAAYAAAARPKGTVLLIHENRGLTPHIRSVAGRLAGSGYSTLALDLLSPEGGTGALGDEARIMAALAAAPRSRFVRDMRSGLDELGRRVPDKEAAAVGFCFGGGQVWSLLDAGERRLGAAVPFYGPAPERPVFSRSRAAVLGIYGALDARVNASRPRAAAALRRARLPHRILTFKGADHAFFNSTGPRYQRVAADQAYRTMMDWFETYLGEPGRRPGS